MERRRKYCLLKWTTHRAGCLPKAEEDEELPTASGSLSPLECLPLEQLPFPPTVATGDGAVTSLTLTQMLFSQKLPSMPVSFFLPLMLLYVSPCYQMQ
jgi:hypothetical protein